MAGGTPLAVIDNSDILGLIYLKDTVKPGIRDQMLEPAPRRHPHRS